MRARVIWTLFVDRGLSWVPVVDETGHPIGTLLRGDLAAAFPDERMPGGRLEDHPIVEDLMRDDVRVVHVSAPLTEARALLESGALTELVVVDHRGVMLGTVSREVLARFT
jgi:CBS-domain-containing membrane protein